MSRAGWGAGWATTAGRAAGEDLLTEAGALPRVGAVAGGLAWAAPAGAARAVLGGGSASAALATVAAAAKVNRVFVGLRITTRCC